MPEASRRARSAAYPITVVESVRRRPLVTRSSAVVCTVSFVFSWSEADCARPRGVNGASGTVRSVAREAYQ